MASAWPARMGLPGRIAAKNLGNDNPGSSIMLDHGGDVTLKVIARGQLFVKF